MDPSFTLYLVPHGADDDWYWMYATVAGSKGEHQSFEDLNNAIGDVTPVPVADRHTFVVTNDQIRDHRTVFRSYRSYMRWHSAHVMRFMLSRAVLTEDDDIGDVIVKFGTPGAFSSSFHSLHLPKF